MDWSEAEKLLLTNKEVQKLAERVDLAYEISKMIIDARLARDMTQAELALATGTRQPSIARLEAGNTLPSLSFLDRIARALETELLPPRFAFLDSSYNYRPTLDVTFTAIGEPVIGEVKSYAGGVTHSQLLGGKKYEYA